MSTEISPFLLKSVLSLLFNDLDFRDKFLPVLKLEYFNYGDKFLYFLAEAIFSYIKIYEKFPEPEVLAEELFKQKGKNLDLDLFLFSKEDLAVFKEFFISIVDADVTDVKYITDNLVRILRLLSVQKTLILNKEAFTNGTIDLDQFTKDIVEASTIATPVSLGVNLLDDLDLRTDLRTTTKRTPGTVDLFIPQFASFLEEEGLPPGSLGFFLAGTNGGKCLKKGTKVLRFSGEVCNVEDIVSGDLLMGPDSSPRKVLATTNGVGQLYTIKPNTGDPWSCNDKHILTLINSSTQNKLRCHDARKIIDIPIEDYLQRGSSFKHRYKLFLPDEVLFAPVDSSPIPPYFLGLWFGDGAKNKNQVQITTADPEIVSYCTLVAKEWGLSISKYSDGITYSLVGELGKRNLLLQELKKLVGDSNTIPSLIKLGSVQTRLDFLAGFIDSDGYLHHNTVEIIQKRLDYAEDIAFIARSLGLRAWIKEVKKSIKSTGFVGTYFCIRLAGEISKIPTILPRKRCKQLTSRKNGKRTGFKVEDGGIGEYYGFELDGDGRFLLGDFTVTHNSMSLIHTGYDAALRGHNVLYVTAELSEDMIKRRFDSCFTGMDLNKIKRSALTVRDKIRKSAMFTNATKRIQIVEFPDGEGTVSDISNIVLQLRRRAFDTNVVVVDYADNLKPERKFEHDRSAYASIYKALRSLAKKQHLVVWTASQMNDAGNAAAEKKSGIITASHVNEARAKIHIADFSIAIARTPEEKEENKARIILLKNRLGPGDGSVIEVDTRFDISRLFGDAKNIVQMFNLDKAKPIKGLEDLGSIDAINEFDDTVSDQKFTASDLNSYYFGNEQV